MQIIIITTLVITVIGIVVGMGLVATGKKYHVKVDEREAAVRDSLPGNNCGACGYAGCDAMAAAVVAGEAPVTGCSVGGQEVAEKLASIMGVTVDPIDRKVAFVKCKGTCEVTHNQGNYIGIKDCRSAVLAGINVTACSFGCLGFGSCQSVCPQSAIKVVEDVAVVNEALCVGCGLCIKACPRGLIELVPASHRIRVRCSNHDRGQAVRAVCDAGCLGCMICTKQCEHDAIHVNAGLALITYENCIECGKCAEKCPAHVIIPLPDGQPAQDVPA